MSQMFQFRVASNTIGKIIPETCAAIYEVLKDDYFKVKLTYCNTQYFPTCN
jgi:hypothetical protein